MKATTFTALSEPNRLAMVELLRERPYSVNEIAERLQLRQPQVSKHLQTLSNAGLVAVYPIGQQRFYGIKPEPFAELDEWMKTFRPFWDSKSSIMERYFELIEQGRVQKLVKEHPFSIERTFDAPLDLVWQAWTEANMLREWWAPDYFTVPTCELDVRAGGQLRIDMQAPDGTVFPMTGTYETVDRQKRLVLVCTPLDGSGKKLFEMRLTASFQAMGEGSKLNVEAYVLWAAPQAGQYLVGLEPGWKQNLAKLNRLLQERTKP